MSITEPCWFSFELRAPHSRLVVIQQAHLLLFAPPQHWLSAACPCPFTALSRTRTTESPSSAVDLSISSTRDISISSTRDISIYNSLDKKHRITFFCVAATG
ncbi:unnamed protein product [Boreogadus saida]